MQSGEGKVLLAFGATRPSEEHPSTGRTRRGEQGGATDADLAVDQDRPPVPRRRGGLQVEQSPVLVLPAT